MAERQSSPTSVYRYYDSNDLLLYVGITSRGTRRQDEHNATKDWWRFVHHQEVEHYSRRELASERERILIRTFRPPFNVQHNPGHERTRAAYLALATKDGLKVRNVYPALVRGRGRTSVEMDVERIGNILILTSVPDEREKLIDLDVRDRDATVVSFAGNKNAKPTVTICRLDEFGRLKLHVLCRRNADKCIGASVMLRMPNGDRKRPTLKRIDLRGPGGVNVR